MDGKNTTNFKISEHLEQRIGCAAYGETPAIAAHAPTCTGESIAQMCTEYTCGVCVRSKPPKI